MEDERLGQTRDLVGRVNAILDRAQDAYNRAQVARHEYRWQQDMSDDDACAVLAKLKHTLYAIPKSKYINIDRGPATGGLGSGLFMVEKSTGAIWGIKAYGVVHRGHYFGTLDAPDVRALAMRATVLHTAETLRELAKEGATS